MTDSSVIEIVLQALILVAKVAGPILATSLAVGLTISLIQSVTQVQEMTLTFVPKIVIMFVSLLVLLPFMLQSLSHFTERLMDRIIALG